MITLQQARWIRGASGEELLLLAIRYGAWYRGAIDAELDRRAGCRRPITERVDDGFVINAA